MTNIGIISDTHGYLDERVFKYFENCDEIWHAGDIGSIDVLDQLAAFKPTRAVSGNIDGQEIRKACPENAFFKIEHVQIFMTHIGGTPPRYAKGVLSQLKRLMPKVFVCGHSHILKVMQDINLNKMLYINPGAAGNHGFHKVRTLIRFSIDGFDLKNMEVIELGMRGKGIKKPSQ